MGLLFPDFLLVLLALASSMRLSLMKAAHAPVSCVARQEIRVPDNASPREALSRSCRKPIPPNSHSCCSA